MGKGTLIAIGLVGLLILISGGMKTNPNDKGFDRPGRKEAPEYNCLHHAKDGICEVPMKHRTVLYCVKGPIKRVVRLREECK